MKREDIVWMLAVFGFLLCALLLWSRNVAASERPDIDYGSATRVAVSFGPSLNGSTNPKYASVGVEKEFGNLAVLTQCSGVFLDPILGACSLVASIKVITYSGLFARVGLGPGFVTRTTDRLSSIPEFNIRYAAGITQGSVEVGGEGSHWSNASLFGGPNLGMDHIGFYFGVSF